MIRRIRQRTQDQAGFSLVELLVVIALIGALSAIALPSLLGNLPEKRLKNAARNLYSDMQRARLQAVQLNRTVTVAFNADGSYQLTFINKEGNKETIKERSLTEYGDVQFGCNTTDWNGNTAAAPTGNLTFTKTGTATATPIPFPILLGSRNINACYAVEVTNFGAVKIRWKQDGGNWN